MCGLFGFVADGDRVPDLATLAEIALATESRGRHAFGLAWVDGRGRIKHFKQTGRIGDHLGILRLAADARILIGHCRYATHGSPADNMNNHPHPSDGGWYVHNGKVANYRPLMERWGCVPRSDCDSEVIGHLIEQRDGPVLDRVRRAVASIRSPEGLAVLALWPRPGRLVVARRGKPLHAGGAPEGSYLASLAAGLPGRVREVPDGTAFLFGRKGEVKRVAL
jgi:glucosamine--fructose-6-phosphate aminotransferase (isomerizing)